MIDGGSNRAAAGARKTGTGGMERYRSRRRANCDRPPYRGEGDKIA